jgi:acetylornithine/N-succinyldiaminopimelate aminotransferase
MSTEPSWSRSLYPTFSRVDLAFERGDGSWLYSTNGDAYLDFACGIAVTGLGHNHPRLVRAITEQASRVWHISNVFRIPEQEQLAARLCEATFADRVFFNNSGAEAVETAIKTARRFHYVNGAPERNRLITFEGAFHGRTLATVAAGGQAKYLEGFEPAVDGFDPVPFGDIEAVERAIGPHTAGILVEPIQGESGVRPLGDAQISRLRELCDESGLLLIFDEVQTGIGRTGHLFAYQATRVEPDILAAAKGLGNGFPVAACLATEAACAGMTPGTHGSTFGGNPLAMAVASEVIDIVSNEVFLQRVAEAAKVLRAGLKGVVDRNPSVLEEVRGGGLLLGLRCRVPTADILSAIRRECLLAVTAGDNVIRFLPPLNITDAEISEGISRLDRAVQSY